MGKRHEREENHHRKGYRPLRMNDVVVSERGEPIVMALAKGAMLEIEWSGDLAALGSNHNVVLLDESLAGYVRFVAEHGGTTVHIDNEQPYSSLDGRWLFPQCTNPSVVHGLTPGVYRFQVWPHSVSFEPDAIVVGAEPRVRVHVAVRVKS
jgi:hypothetical protein